MGELLRVVSKVLIIEDQKSQYDVWASQCMRLNKIPLWARTRAEAVGIARREKPGLALVDCFIPDWQAPTIIKDLKRIDSALFVVAVSSYMTVEHSSQCMRAGADDCIVKPISCKAVIEYAQSGKRLAVKSDQIPTAADVEWAHIARVLADCDGNQSRASEVLDISRKTLERRLNERLPKALRTSGVPRRSRAQTISAEAQHAVNNAQFLVAEAFGTISREQRTSLAEAALAVSPDCIDAYLLLAEAQPDVAAATALTRKAILVGERVIGVSGFVELAGRLWSTPTTRSYLRARLACARFAWRERAHDEAIGHCRELLRLNPDDQLGARYELARWLAALGRTEELHDLADACQDDLVGELLAAPAC